MQVTFAYPVDFIAYVDRGSSAQVRFEGRFDFDDSDGGIHHLDASSQPWEDPAVVLALRHDRVAAASATEDDARLRIEFDSGRVLTAGPDPQYENWAVIGPGFHLISSPGGGVAHFPNGGGRVVKFRKP
ncbi:MAG: DUF6188 family protein [Solirubrobacteraceae bacterium]